MRGLLLYIVCFFSTNLTFANSQNCDRYIIIDQQNNEVVLGNEQICFVPAINSQKKKNKVQHANFNFVDSVVISFNIVNQSKSKSIYVELGNPHMNDLYIEVNDSKIRTNKFQKKRQKNGQIELHQHRNFRFEIDLLQDTTSILIVAKTKHFWQPIPIVIFKDNHLRKFNAIEGYIFGNMLGLFSLLALIFVTLIFTIRNLKIIWFSSFAMFCMLYILYEFNLCYKLWDNVNPKFDLLLLLVIMNGQIIFAELFTVSFFQFLFKNRYRILIKKIITTSLLVRLAFVLIGIISIFIFNGQYFKQVEYIIYWSTLFAAISYIYLSPKFLEVIDKKVIAFILMFVNFSVIAYFYLFQKLGLISYSYGYFYQLGQRLIPANTIMPELFVLSFLGLLVIATILIFKQYMHIKKQKTKLQHLTNMELTTYPVSLVNVIEKERVRISQGLHDNIGVLLSLVSVKISDLLKKSDVDIQVKSELKAQINQLIQENRNTSHQINPGALKYISLEDFFKDYFQTIQQQASQVDFDISNMDLLDDIELSKKGQIHRMIMAMLPSKKMLIKYKSVSLQIERYSNQIDISAFHLLNEDENIFRENHLNKIKSLLPFIEAYEGSYNIEKLSPRKTKVQIVIPDKYFTEKN